MALKANTRLSHKAQFQQGLDQPVVARTAHFVLHALAQAADPSQQPAPMPEQQQTDNDTLIGAVIPKRWAKRAVTRNAIRRQIYQAFSDWRARIPHGIHVVRLRQAFAAQQFHSATSLPLKATVRHELNQLFAKRAVS
jgi:ribonuclease P protein component